MRITRRLRWWWHFELGRVRFQLLWATVKCVVRSPRNFRLLYPLLCLPVRRWKGWLEAHR